MAANVIHFSFAEGAGVKHCRLSSTNMVENGRVYPSDMRQHVELLTTIPSPICSPADSVIGDFGNTHSQCRVTKNRMIIPVIDSISRN
jgi:hypothetical protein